MKFSKSDTSYLLLSLLFFLLFGWLLYDELNRQGYIGDRKIVGTITFKHRVAQRKLDDSAVWEELQQKVAVYNRDTIRTEDMSEAVIELSGGAKIQLEDNSMIILDIDEEGDANINFTYGSIKANSADGASDHVNIISDNKIIALSQSDISLKKDEGNGVLDFIVNRGEALLKTSLGGEEVSKTVKKDEMVVITGETLELEKVPITLHQPAGADRSRYYSDRVPADVTLTWSNPDNVKNLKIEISSDPNFSNIIQRKNVSGTSDNVKFPEGTFYWRIVGTDAETGEEKKSGGERLSILQKQKIRLITPGNETVFNYVNQEPYISFLWDEDKSASAYVLEIATDPGFQNIQTNLDTLTTSISHRLKSGEYYARVVTRSKFPQAVQISNANKFRVKQNLTLPAPIPLKPIESEQISSEFLRENGYIFTWMKSLEITETEIQIAKDPLFSEKVAESLDTSNFYLMKNILEPGKYYWKIRGKDKNGTMTDFSRTLAFTITKIDTIFLVSPAQGEVLDIYKSIDGVKFAWSDSAVKPPYRLEISEDASFKNPVKGMDAQDKSMVIRDLQAKKYFWRIQKKNVQGALLGESQIQSFIIEPGIEEPKPIFPSPKETVNMVNENYLSMKWDKVADAENYNVKLYKVENGKQVLIFQTKTKELEYKFRDMEKLDKGSFIWSVTAETTTKNKIAKSPEVKTGFTLTLPDTPPPRFVSPSIHVIEE